MTTGNSPRVIRRGGSVLAVSIRASVAFPGSLSRIDGRRPVVGSSSGLALPGTASLSSSASAP